MSVETILKGIRRGGGGDNEVRVNADRHGNLLVAQGLPPYAELTRLGGGYQAMSTTGVTGLVARPTVTALVTLWNGEPDGGLSYVIDRAFAHNLVKTAAVTAFSIWLCVHPTGMAAPTDDITTKNSLSGKKGYGGRARFDVDATVAADGWFPWGNWGEGSATGVYPSAHVEAEVAGRIILPPSAGLSLQVVVSITATTFTAGFAWYEVQLDIA